MEFLFRSMERFTKGGLAFICGEVTRLSSALSGNMLMYPSKRVLESYPGITFYVSMMLCCIFVSLTECSDYSIS